jgi:hypothetical protein
LTSGGMRGSNARREQKRDESIRNVENGLIAFEG